MEGLELRRKSQKWGLEQLVGRGDTGAAVTGGEDFSRRWHSGHGCALPGVNSEPELRGRCGSRMRLARPEPELGSVSSRDPGILPGLGGILPGLGGILHGLGRSCPVWGGSIPVFGGSCPAVGALPAPLSGPKAWGSSPEGVAGILLEIPAQISWKCCVEHPGETQLCFSSFSLKGCFQKGSFKAVLWALSRFPVFSWSLEKPGKAFSYPDPSARCPGPCLAAPCGCAGLSLACCGMVVVDLS